MRDQVDDRCIVWFVKTTSRAYLNHLIRAKELTFFRFGNNTQSSLLFKPYGVISEVLF